MDVIEISRRAVGKVDVVVHARCACNFERTTAMGNNQGNQTEHSFSSGKRYEGDRPDAVSTLLTHRACTLKRGGHAGTAGRCPLR